MAITNQERVGKAMDLLREGLAPFVVREFKNLHQAQAADAALHYLDDDRTVAMKPLADWDVAALLKLIWEAWNDVFGRTLGRAERSLVQELRDFRNKWAHQEPFSSDDADRALDSMARLLTAVSAPQADEVAKMKLELRRLIYDEQVRSEKRKVGGSLIETAATGTLKPWREVVTPHADVASGRYQQAEFAADLWQVHLGEGSAEYKEPQEFFRRTFLTESLKRLLVGGVQRISGKGGDPVVQLQTNFGGGKTHSMLALYHFDMVPVGDEDNLDRFGPFLGFFIGRGIGTGAVGAGGGQRAVGGAGRGGLGAAGFRRVLAGFVLFLRRLGWPGGDTGHGDREHIRAVAGFNFGADGHAGPESLDLADADAHLELGGLLRLAGTA